jgi:hypothetical protein
VCVEVVGGGWGVGGGGGARRRTSRWGRPQRTMVHTSDPSQACSHTRATNTAAGARPTRARAHRCGRRWSCA